MNALILVDLQNDFLPGGPLGVPHGDEVIPVANRLARRFEFVVATQDWHPPNHGSFAANHPGRKPGDVVELSGLEQILWPLHCVEETAGAAFAAALDTSRVARVFRKGIDPGIDSYSTFFDNAHRRSTGLADYLHERGAQDVYILGLATDYCVKFSTLDAVELGFQTFVVEDGCRPVELQPGDAARAIDEMRAAGAHIVRSDKLLGQT